MQANEGEMQNWKTDLKRYEPIRGEELPATLREMVGYMQPLGPMFPDDWLPMMALTFWSALVPSEARVENLGLNLWFLGINPQGVGKNVTSDELYRVTRTVLQLREREMALFTGGSAEGMGRKLAGAGKSLLAYHAEYSGFLKSLRALPGAKEMLCNMYDGRDISHQLAQGGVEASDPHVVVVATTTMTAITESGSRDDLSNGYLSRFLFCAPDSLDVGPERFPTERERYGLAVKIADWMEETRDVTAIATTPYAERVLAGYRVDVGLHTGRVRDLDAELRNEDTPPGRLVARAKKIAGLLALADCRTEIGPMDMALAIRFVGRAEAYARRVSRWIGMGKGDTDADLVLKHLERKGPLTSRKLQQDAHRTTDEVASALDILIGRGEVVAEQGTELQKNGEPALLYRLVRKR